jgi:non-heme chloroperoxidase
MRTDVRRAECEACRTRFFLPAFPHGMPTTEAKTINADLLAFIQS